MSKTETKRRTIQSLRDKPHGPIKVFVETGERDDKGELVKDANGELAKELIMEDLYYRPFVITPQLEAELAEMTQSMQSGDNSRPVASTVNLLLKMVHSWDLYLTDEDAEAGVSVPLDPEGLSDIPAEILNATIVACTSHGKPPKAQPEKLPSSFSKKG
jgi:hypothetical protein